MLTPQEILAGLSDPTRQAINSGVSQAEFGEIGGVYCMLRNDKTHKDDYKTSIQIPNTQNFVRGKAGCKKDGNEFRRNYAFAFAVLKVIAQTHKNKGAVPIPQEIRLVAAYMVYRAMELADRKYGGIEKADKAVSQSEILKGLGLGHNAFTKWGMRPKQYYYVTRYEQPDSPIRYMGAKTGEYGYAIRNLVYQAGKHKAFADIFGGGGNATLAVPPVDTVQCYYNEVDPIAFNAVEVLKDEKLCQKLVGLYREFCGELQGKGRSEFLAGYLPPNATRRAINNAFHSKDGKTKGQVGKIKDINPVSVRLTYSEMSDFIAEYEKGINLCMACGQTEIRAGGEVYNLYELKNKDYHNILWRKFSDPAVQAVAEVLGITPRGHHAALTDDSIGDGFEDDIPLDVTRDDGALFKKYMGGVPLTAEEQAKLGELEVSAVGQRFDFVHYMMLCYWYLFDGMAKGYRASGCPFAKEEDKVFYAFAYIFLRYSAFRRNKISDNDIRNADEPTTLSDGSTVYKNNEKIEKFLGCSLLPEIEAFHKRFRKVELSNEDFRVFLDSIINNKHYSDKGRVVFYSDSPYLKTVGYDSKFTIGDMRDLIQKLVHCGQKFIFSCRACKSAAESKEEGEGKPTINSANRSLRDDLFHVFESEAKAAGISLSVLAVRKGGKSLPALIKGSQVAEIMICNFDIHGFSNNGKSAKTKFTAYTYHDFLNIFESNAIL